jgi:hypothetical protein
MSAMNVVLGIDGGAAKAAEPGTIDAAMAARHRILSFKISSRISSAS